MPNYISTQVMDSMLPPKRSDSSCRRSSRMWAAQDGTGSSMVHSWNARSANGSDSPGESAAAAQARCADGMGSPGAATPARSSDVVPLIWLLLNWVDW